MPKNKPGNGISLILLAMALFTMASCSTTHKVQSEIVIDAPPSQVWQVITNANGYKDWNPILTPLQGKYSEGDVIEYEWKQSNGKVSKVKSTVVKLIENKELHQSGGTAGILTYDHRYILKAEDKATRVIQSEVYKGIGLWFWDAEQMKIEYQKVNQNLKEKVESIAN